MLNGVPTTTQSRQELPRWHVRHLMEQYAAPAQQAFSCVTVAASDRRLIVKRRSSERSFLLHALTIAQSRFQLVERSGETASDPRHANTADDIERIRFECIGAGIALNECDRHRVGLSRTILGFSFAGDAETPRRGRENNFHLTISPKKGLRR